MVRQRQINCIPVPYMAAVIVLLMPNTLRAEDCRCTKFGFGVCIHDYSCPSSGVDEHFLSLYVREGVAAARRKLEADRRELEAAAGRRLANVERVAAAGRELEAARRELENTAAFGEQEAPALRKLEALLRELDADVRRELKRVARIELDAARRQLENTAALGELVAAARRDQGNIARIVAMERAPFLRMRILETGYSLLTEIAGEEPDYGLYSYAIAVNNKSRSARFLSDVLTAIPPVEDTAARRSQTNIFYIPIRKDKVNEFPDPGNEYAKFFISHANELYDIKLARALLDHLCDPPAEEIRAVCEGDLSRGPYIFSYAQPASMLAPAPPPYLFMDLSDVHERAFPEIIAAFKAQVKRDDISDRAKIDTLRLKLLSIVLTAADFVAPVRKAMADMVHIADGRSEGDKK